MNINLGHEYPGGVNNNEAGKKLAQKVRNFDFYMYGGDENSFHSLVNKGEDVASIIKARFESFLDSYKKSKDSFYIDQNFGLMCDASMDGYFGNEPEMATDIVKNIDLKNPENFTVSVKLIDLINEGLFNVSLYDYDGDYDIDEGAFYGYTAESFSPEFIERLRFEIDELLNNPVKFEDSYFLTKHLERIINTFGNTGKYNIKETPIINNDGYYVFVRHGDVLISKSKSPNQEIDAFINNPEMVPGGGKDSFTKIDGYDTDEYKLFLKQNFNRIQIDEEYYDEYVMLMQPDFRTLIEKDLNCNLLDLSPLEQYHVIKFLRNAKNKDINKVKDFTNDYGQNGLRTFLSIENGGDRMGAKIISLGKNLEHDEAKEIFKGYGDLIDSAKKLSFKILNELDKNDLINNDESLKKLDIKKLPNELVDSLMLRAKDILIGAEKVLEDQRLDSAKENLKTSDVTDAVLGINTLISMLANINENGDEYQYKKLESTGNKAGEYLNKYLVTDKNGFEYNLKVFVRPRAEEGAQARINIELSFDTQKPNERLQKAFYNETVNYKEGKKITGSVLRIGIDRDDYNYEGAVSLDIGRSERETDKYSRTGDVLGKLLSMTSNEGHHETTAFSKEFADPENFAKITTLLAQYFER